MRLALLALLLVGLGRSAWACPATETCTYPVASGTNPNPDELVSLLEQATYQTLPGAVALPAIEVGPERTPTRGPIACATLKPISVVESGMQQFCEDTGLTVISFDCGYGLMQITTGAEDYGIGLTTSAAVNVGAAARILASKWNAEYGGPIGESDPLVIEDWYYAFWAYNGFLFRNHPENPTFPPNRPPYNGPGTLARASYPYQELVLGLIRHPYLHRWEPIEVTYPAAGSIETDPQPLAALEPEHLSSCAPDCPDCDAGVLDGASDANLGADAGGNEDGGAGDSGRLRPGYELLNELPVGTIEGGACRCTNAPPKSGVSLLPIVLIFVWCGALRRRRSSRRSESPRLGIPASAEKERRSDRARRALRL
ncbi:MAG: hypothetical protein HYV07_19425 [Deltaproteobacteria bacterium]|nr:hypothetical protein [Deltaproteobacteria bacterium]